MIRQVLPDLAGNRHFHMRVGTWWTSHLVLGPAWSNLDVGGAKLPEETIGVMKATCPITDDERKVGRFD